MRLTLFKKILISMLFISTIMVIGMVWLINYSFHTGLQNYLIQGEMEKLELLAEKIYPYYSPQDGWDKVTVKQWEGVLTQVFARPRKDNVSRTDRLAKRFYLLDQNNTPVFKKYTPRDQRKLIKIPIKYQQQTIGWIMAKKRNAMSGELEKNFYDQQQNNFMWIVLWVAIFSLILAWILVRHLLAPLKRLEGGANALQQGDYLSQIEVKGNDEFAALSRRFNALSRSLLRQKETREQWLADISHELRTPISVLKSEIEALQDGIRQAEPKYIDSLHFQVQNLSQLVDDLYQLSLSDAGMQFDLSELVDIQQVISTSCRQYQLRYQEKQVLLQTDFVKENTYIKGNKKGLIQLFTNLLENSLRYTDTPGQLHIGIKIVNQQLQICFEDTSPGVPDNALPKLFERLYRVDASRSRLSGGAGLGLSICETIVQVHHGEMVATHSSLGGLAITITLPLAAVHH